MTDESYSLVSWAGLGAGTKLADCVTMAGEDCVAFGAGEEAAEAANCSITNIRTTSLERAT